MKVNKKLKNIKVVLFDHDDTLVATKEAKWAHHKFVAKKFYGKILLDSEILPHWGKPLPHLVSLLYGTNNIKQALANNASCHEDFPKILYEDTLSVLNQLHAQGMLLGIVTATSRFSFEHDLTSHKFPREIINYTQTADDTKFHKPDPRVFKPALKWLKKQSISPEEVLYVGDGLHDMKAAIGAWFNFIGVETGLVSSAQFKEQGAQSFPTIASLPTYLKT